MRTTIPVGRNGITILVLICTTALTAQAYRPMLVDGNRWGQRSSGIGAGSTFVDQIQGDSTIGGVTYKKVVSVGGSAYPNCIELLREDTTSRRVYVRLDTAESVLYDFAWDLGTTHYVTGFCDDFNLAVVLDSVTSSVPSDFQCFIDNPSFHYFHFESNPGYVGPIWMEGVGSLGGLRHPAMRGGPGELESLHCHGDSAGNNDIECVDLWPVDSCYRVADWTGIGENMAFLIIVAPNPTSDRLYLSFRSAQAPTGEFTLLNSAGKVVRRFSPGGQSVELEVDVSAQPPGLYVLRYQDRDGVRWSEKVVIE